MATKKKMLQAAAGSAGGAGLDITDVFSTFVYDGAQTTLVVNNGIDLATEDGITWIKCRNASEDHFLFSSLQNSDGQTLFLKPNETNAANGTNGVSQTSTGFSLAGGDGLTNQINKQYASWTFRKAPKFFDIVGPFTGDGVNGRVLSHNLGSTPGLVIIKRTSTGTAAQGSWFTYHRSAGFSGGLSLNGSEPAGYTFASPITAASDTTITINNPANNGNINALGESYIAYLFAHNPNDGAATGFGPDGDSQVISCGSYTGNQNATGPVIDLGFEPQWVMVKNSTSTGGWQIMDSMRGIVTGGGDGRLQAQANAAESTPSFIDLTPTGFQVTSTGGNMNANNAIYTFMAIRRGPLSVPEDATKVFSMDTWGSGPPAFTSGFPADLAWTKDINSSGGQWYWLDRLRGEPTLESAGNLPEDPAPNAIVDAGDNPFDFQDGWYDKTGTATDYQSWMWKRAPGHFDMVAYSGSNSAKTIVHNLTVPPEMIWVKSRTNSNRWTVFHKDIGPNYRTFIDLSQGFDVGSAVWNNTAPTSTVFTVGTDSNTNFSGHTFISYLFASAPGVSKVGSYDGDGTTDGSKIIDCGFTTGCRFLLIKTSNTGGNWMIYDTRRGIGVSNDPVLQLNNTVASNANFDNLIPNSSGFAVIQNTDGALTTNESGHSYIFYAIA